MNASDLSSLGSPAFWGVSSRSRVWVAGHARAVKGLLERTLRGVSRPPDGPVDVAFITPVTSAEWAYFARKIAARLAPDGLIWCVYAEPDTLFEGCLQTTPELLLARVADQGMMERRRVELEGGLRASAAGFASK